ncbi:MAG: ribosomal protein S18-alanine N-acetyltransferase [Clostridia bacterium]|nr:ribosomal protein S18-alanine N-acetyltransferase [Clostridia bacterium]
MNDRIIVYREMTLPDIEQVYEIECASFSQPWSVESLIGEVVENDVACYYVAECNGRIVGYAGEWVMYDESHMTNIAVIPEFRRSGVATRLILSLMRAASSKGAKRMTLEVREFNFGAQALYASLSFAKVGIRKKYYSDTGENAFILWNDDINATLAENSSKL